MRIATLQDVLVEELRDLFDAEKQLVKALPKMARSAGHSELQQAFREHTEVTKGQVARLEQVFEMMGVKARSKPCSGMKGIIEEGEEIQQEDFGEGMRDAALVGAGRRVEHYEIAAYTACIEMAQIAGMRDAAQLLQQTLREEMDFERQLAQISKRMLKEVSRMAGREQQAGARRQESRAARASAAGGRSAGRSRTKVAGGNSRGRAASARASSGQRPRRGSQRNAGGSAHPLVDHEEIRRWAEERGAQPACIRGTGGGEDTGMIRLDFPGYTGEESLEPISWDDWFRKFDESDLALLVQDTIGSGEKSNFNKLVKREHAEARGQQRPKAKHAGGR